MHIWDPGDDVAHIHAKFNNVFLFSVGLKPYLPALIGNMCVDSDGKSLDRMPKKKNINVR